MTDISEQERNELLAYNEKRYRAIHDHCISKIDALKQEAKDYRAIAERLEQGVLAIAETCPMSAMTRRKLKNLVRAEPQSAPQSESVK